MEVNPPKQEHLLALKGKLLRACISLLFFFSLPFPPFNIWKISNVSLIIKHEKARLLLGIEGAL